MTRINTFWLFTTILLTANSNAQPVTHRWSFNSTGADANGTLIPDAIAAAPGVIVKTGAARLGTVLTLSGTISDNVSATGISAYFDLPIDIASQKTNMPVET